MQARNPPKTSVRDARIRGKSLPTYNSITQILPRAVARGLLFFSLIRPLHEPFVCFPIIWITHLNYPVQLDYANTHPFRYRGVLFYSLLSVRCTNLYWLPIIWITHLNYPVQLDYANTSPFRCVGSIVCFFSPSAGILYIFFYFHYTETLGGFRSYQLPKTI